MTIEDRGAFTINGFCAWSGIGRTKAYELMDSGELPVIRIGGRVLISIEDAKELLARHRCITGKSVGDLRIDTSATL